MFVTDKICDVFGAVNVSEYTLYTPEPVGTGNTTWFLETKHLLKL
jgi:hypothetical protein